MKNLLLAGGVLLSLAGTAQACNTPNPNLLGPPFVDNCPLPASSLNKLGFATSAAVGQISVAAGAILNRMGDKLYVGKNTNVNDGNVPASVKDWAETLFPNSTAIAGIASLAQLGNIGVLGGTRGSDGAAGGYAIGTTGICVSDFPTIGSGTACAGGYFEALKPVGAYGSNFAHGVEINVDEMNSGTVNGVSYPVTYQPYTSPFPPGLTDALRLASGGARGGAQPATDAIAIINNGANFQAGIVFQQNAINGTNGITGTGTAIAMAKGQAVSWYSPDGLVNSSILGIGTTSDLTSVVELGKGMMQLFSSGNAAVDILSATGSFSALTTYANGSNTYVTGIDGTGANFIITNNGNTGDVFSVVSGNVTVGQTATNTNILGAVKLGSAGSWNANGSVATTMTSLGPTGSHTTIQEWLTVVDSAGTVRYVPAY